MRLSIPVLVATLLAAAPAAAATVVALPDYDDQMFVTACRDKPLDQGGFNEDCEHAVAEIRMGDAKASGGNQEVTVRNPFVGRGFAGVDGQLAITAGSSFDLTMRYDGSDFFFSVDGNAVGSVATDLSVVGGLLIRMSNRDGSFSLTDMSIRADGGAVTRIPDMPAANVSPIPTKSYVGVVGFDFSLPFTVLATANFARGLDTTGSDKNNGSNVAAQFKFVTPGVVPEVPLPATAFLLIGALGALGVARRRR